MEDRFDAARKFCKQTTGVDPTEDQLMRAKLRVIRTGWDFAEQDQLELAIVEIVSEDAEKSKQ